MKLCFDFYLVLLTDNADNIKVTISCENLTDSREQKMCKPLKCRGKYYLLEKDGSEVGMFV